MDFYDEAQDALAPYRPSGRTLGGDRPLAPAFTGNPVELRPAYVPKTVVQLPAEQLQLAVPSIKAHQRLKWDHEGEDAEALEVRNFADRASEQTCYGSSIASRCLTHSVLFLRTVGSLPDQFPRQSPMARLPTFGDCGCNICPCFFSHIMRRQHAECLLSERQAVSLVDPLHLRITDDVLLASCRS